MPVRIRPALPTRLRGAEAAPGSHKPRDLGSIPGHATRESHPGVAQQPEQRSDTPPSGGASPPPRTKFSDMPRGTDLGRVCEARRHLVRLQGGVPTSFRAGVAQFGERLPSKQRGAGSIPVIGSNRLPRHGPGRRHAVASHASAPPSPGHLRAPLAQRSEHPASTRCADVRIVQGVPPQTQIASRDGLRLVS